MKLFFKPFILFLLTAFSFILTACVARPINGKYVSKYSYHPYYDMYPEKMVGRKKRYNHSYNKSSTSHRVAYNDDENYPSNVPANNY